MLVREEPDGLSTPESGQVLQSLAKGAAAATLTREASASLKRGKK